MKVILSPRAEKQLRKITKIDQIAIAKKIRDISVAEKIPGEEKLAGFKNIFRIRVGDYRIVYHKQSSQFYIILIRHRRDVYDLLRQILD